MNKNPILKKILKYTFIVSGFIPAHYLLFWALYLLLGPLFFGNYQNIKSDLETILIYGSIIIGIFGYFGLLFSLIPKFENRYNLKIIFLALGIIGFISFLNVFGNDGSWKLFFTHIFSLDWFLCYWPNIVSLVLIVYFLYKFLISQKKYRK